MYCIRRTIYLLLIVLSSPSLAADRPVLTSASATHVYVVRRPLGGPNAWEPLVNRWEFVHSGLLFKTEEGRFALLEYMGDSKVYLSEPSPEVIREFEDAGYATVRMAGQYDDEKGNAGPAMFRWTRQLKGTRLNAPIRLSKLKKLMVDLTVNKKFNLTSHNCHLAQERLRKAIGLDVD